MSKRGLRPVSFISASVYAVITLIAFYSIKTNADKSLESAFKSEAEIRAEIISEIFQQRIVEINMIRAFFEGSKTVEPGEFSSFVEGISGLKGIEAVFFIKRVSDGKYNILSVSGIKEQMLKEKLIDSGSFAGLIDLITDNKKSVSGINETAEMLILSGAKSQDGNRFIIGQLINVKQMAETSIKALTSERLPIKMEFAGRDAQNAVFLDDRHSGKEFFFLAPRLKEHTSEINLPGNKAIITITAGPDFIDANYSFVHFYLLILLTLAAGVTVLYLNKNAKVRDQAVIYAGKTEKELLDKAAELDRFFNLSVDMLCIANTEGKLLRLNPEWENVLGFSLKELTGKYFIDFVHPDDRMATLNAVSSLKSGNNVVDFINRYRHKDGTYRHIEWRSAPYEGSFIYAAARDVTRKIETERILREKDEMFKRVVQNLPAVISITDKDGIFRMSEGKGLDALGLKPGQVVGKNVYEFYSAYPEIESCIRQALKGTSVHTKITLGDLIFDTLFMPVAGDNGEVAATINIAMDITQDTNKKKEKERLIAMLETKNAELERFVYTVSHDLKNPLITIRGFSGALLKMLSSGKLDEAGEAAAFISKAAGTMNELLNDLLQVARLGKMELKKSTVRIADVFSAASELVSGEMVKQGAEFRILTLPPGSEIVFADEKRLVEAVQNLISNAFKFGRQGDKVIVEAGAKITADGQPVYFIRDNGIGIEAKYLEKVFNLFERLAPEIEGTGVGLAIVKRVIEMHGGRVWAESEGKGQGAVFCFTLPWNEGKGEA